MLDLVSENRDKNVERDCFKKKQQRRRQLFEGLAQCQKLHYMSPIVQTQIKLILD